MTSVQMSDLDLAVSADDADLTLIRKSNTTDYKVTVQLLRNINIPGLPVLAVSPGATDLLIVSQSGTNCQCNFGSIGFVLGTRMWFYQASAPNGIAPIFWRIVPAQTGDKVLAVRGGTTYTTAGISQGTWTTANHTLTGAEMPSHTHLIRKTSQTVGAPNNSGPLRGQRPEHNTPTLLNFATSEPTGGGQPHNHGDTWRPYAYVGLICEKVL